MNALTPVIASPLVAALEQAEASKAALDASWSLDADWGDKEAAYLADQIGLKAQVLRATGVSADRLTAVLS